MIPGPGRVAQGTRALLRAVLWSLLVALAVAPTALPLSYVEESPSPTPSPTTASPSPSPTASAEATPLPPADDDYWDDMTDPTYTPPPPARATPTRGAQPRERHDRVEAEEQQGGDISIDAGQRPDGQQGGADYGDGTGTTLRSRDAYPPGTFEGGYGLFTPQIDDMPITANPDALPPVPISGTRSTEPVIRRLREANAPLDQVARTLAPFPVAGLAEYTAEWTPPAPGKGIEKGKGAAIMAKEGTPVVASANGPVHLAAPDPSWGTAIELTGPDGTRYRYGRLLRVAPAIQEGMKVTRGQIIGFVGSTGTVTGGSYLWFQLIDKPGAIVPPFEYLDRWLKEALTTARVTTGLPAVDVADDVAAGLVSPEEAGITLGPDGRPVSDEQPLSPLEAFLSTLFFSLLGWRGVRRLRRMRRPAGPVPERLDLDLDATTELGADLTEPIAGTEPAAT